MQQGGAEEPLWMNPSVFGEGIHFLDGTSVRGSALRQVPYRTQRPPLLPPSSPPPASAQWFVPIGAPLLFISAPLAGAQSELQPGNRTHTKPRRLLCSPPPASVSIFVATLGRSPLSSSCLVSSSSFCFWFQRQVGFVSLLSRGSHRSF